MNQEKSLSIFFYLVNELSLVSTIKQVLFKQNNMLVNKFVKYILIYIYIYFFFFNMQTCIKNIYLYKL